MPGMDAIISQRMKAVRENPGLLYGSRDRPSSPLPPSAVQVYEVLPLPEHPVRGMPDRVLAARYEGVPLAFREALAELVDDDELRCWRCGTPCGVVVQRSGCREVRRWVFAALVSRPASGLPVSTQCEACTPDVAPEPWPADVPPSVVQGDLSECRVAPGGREVLHVRPVGAATCRCGGVSPTPPPADARHQD